MLTAIAYAVEGGQPPAPSPLGAFVPLLVIFAIFYFLLIRPQQKKAREHSKFLEMLKVGDDVITSGGICGKVSKVEEKEVVLEIADKVKIRVVKSHLYPRGAA